MSLRNAHLEKAVTAAIATPVIEIAQRLRDEKLRHIYILDNDFPVGIISITDINAKIVAEGRSPQGLTAADIMTTPLHMVELDNDLSKAYYEMIAHNSLAIPIIDNGVLVGVLSLSEALRQMRVKHA